MFRSMRNKFINVFSTRDGLPRKAVFLWEWLTRKREEIDRDTVLCEGWLYKEGQVNESWKRRW
jgi:hypothetical protein